MLKFRALSLRDSAKAQSSTQKQDIDEIVGHEYPKQRTINTKFALILSVTLLLLAGTLITAIIITRGDVLYDQQRAVLLSLYESTSGVNWTSTHGWFSSDSYYSWEGITCRDENIIKILQVKFNEFNERTYRFRNGSFDIVISETTIKSEAQFHRQLGS